MKTEARRFLQTQLDKQCAVFVNKVNQFQYERLHKSFQEEVLWVSSFPSSLMCLSRGYSPGAAMMLFVLLCMESIAFCASSVSLCIELTDQRRQATGAYSPVHSKETHSKVAQRKAFYLMHCMWCDYKGFFAHCYLKFTRLKQRLGLK